MPGPACDRSGRAPHPSRRGGVRDRASFRRPARSSASSIIISGSCRQAWYEPTAVRLLAGRPRENAARILMETERLLRVCGHRKVTVADIADACGFSAANVYRYFSSRRAILDTLASHYLHETVRAALDCAIRNSDSARGRLSGFLSGLN